MNNHSADNAAITISGRELTKTYRIGTKEIQVLRGINIEIRRGEFTAVIGPSGAGKSTLLHILGTLERPSSGELMVIGQDIARLSDDKIAKLRRERIGFVFQFHHLLPAFTALENVMMPYLILHGDRRRAGEAATELLEMMKMGDRLQNKPAELSGGEQQRVAVARALVNRPDIVLADEPTGNLDRGTGRNLEDDLIKYCRERGSAILVVTHNEEWAHRSDRMLTLVDGLISDS